MQGRVKRRQVNPPKVGEISQVSCAENAELAYVRSLTCNSLLMASLYSFALFSSSANISTCAVRGNTGDVNRSVEEASAWSPKERSEFSCRVSLRERNPYPLAHQRRRRTRSSIALIHIMAHVVRSRPLKGMRYGDTTEWRTSTKQATSRKSRCKLQEVDQTDETPILTEMSFLEFAEIKIFFPTETSENRHKFAPHVPSIITH